MNLPDRYTSWLMFYRQLLQDGMKPDTDIVMGDSNIPKITENYLVGQIKIRAFDELVEMGVLDKGIYEKIIYAARDCRDIKVADILLEFAISINRLLR
jgi:hypothetical protein